MNGCTVLPVRLQSGIFHSFCFIKQHTGKRGENAKVLFVSNVGRNITEEQLKTLFSAAGTVESVSSSGDNCKDVTASRFAHITFKSSKSVDRALNLTMLVLEPSSEPQGIEKYLADYSKQHQPVETLQAEVNDFMLAFEEKEMSEKKELDRLANEPDDDGFVMVTRKRKTVEETQVQKKKKKKTELKNFYTFQMREEKRERLADLRKQFEEDKQRIEQLKSARKFKPF